MTTSPPSGQPPPPLSITTPAYQTNSPFFTRLPYEIRQQIYLEAFHTSSLRQHIILLASGNFTHTPCITLPTSPDVRFSSFRDAPLGSLERQTWLQRLKTEWCLHWACEDAHIDNVATVFPRPPPSTFLPVLLTCKQTYLEALPSLYRHLTFLFTDLTTAETFLFTFPRPHHPIHHPIRNIELSIHLSNLLTELYFPYAELAAASAITPTHGDGPPPTIKPSTSATPTRLSATNNPLSRVCDRLLTLSTSSPLSHLHIWLDTRDLRPWHKRVSETRMFAPLTQVRMRQPGGSFILALPELPGDLVVVDGPPVLQVLTRGLGAEHFFSGDGDGEGGRVFKVVREPRANNWSTYFTALLPEAAISRVLPGL